MPPTLGARSKAERDYSYEAMRRREKPWRRWYSLKAWKIRRRDQLRSEPLCRRCRAKGETVEATVADHVIPHRGDWELFIRGKLQSLCEPCHSGEVQSEERRGVKR